MGGDRAPARGPYPELTPLSVLTGVALGAVLNMGICYAGLQIGFTIVGSAVAAVLGFGLLRGLIGAFANRPGRTGRIFGSILEVNVFQTVASAVNTVNAGIIFTVPVLFLLGFEKEIDYPALLLATMAGSVLGVVMIIPLRKQIIDYERLRFPEGVATAAILKSPGAGIQKALLLVLAIGVSAVISALTKEWVRGSGALLSEEIHAGEALGLPGGFRLVFAVSLLSLGAGYIAGRPGLVVLYGTLLNYWVLIPVCLGLGWIPEGFADFAFASKEYGRAEEFNAAFSRFTSRHVGIGMILGGAIAGIVVALPALKAAFASLRAPAAAGGRREEVSIRVLNVGMILGLALLFFAAKHAGGENVGWVKAAILTVVGGAWLWLAGLVVAQTTGRTDWSPLSGLALIAIAIFMTIMGTTREFVVPAVTLGAAICVATSMAADMMADLKTGTLVGSRPARQQVAQILTCWIGPAIALGTVILLWKAYAFGPDQAKILHDRAVAEGVPDIERYEDSSGNPKIPQGTPSLGAPQAGALKAAIDIVQSGNVPLGKYLTGALLGLVVSLLVSPGLGVMVGLSMYLPFEYMIVFGIGGITNILIRRWKGARFAEDKGVPIAAGLIVGDALVGVVHAMVKVLGSLGGGA